MAYFYILMKSNVGKIRKILSLNIKNQRKVLGISQEKLAEIAGISVQTVNAIEGCRKWVSDKTIQKISLALQGEDYQLLTPFHAAERGASPADQGEMLQGLKEDIRKNVDVLLEVQFDGVLKSRTSIPRAKE
jgi:transcriptional regulator with XRE-family HTH domain